MRASRSLSRQCAARATCLPRAWSRDDSARMLESVLEASCKTRGSNPRRVPTSQSLPMSVVARLRLDSLFARLVLTFVVGMALTMLVTLWVQLPEREAFVFRISALRASYRLADLLKLMDKLPSAGRQELAAIATARGVETRLDVPPPQTDSEPGASAVVFRDLLREDLGHDWAVAVEVSPVQLPAEPGSTRPVDGFEFKGQARL